MQHSAYDQQKRHLWSILGNSSACIFKNYMHGACDQEGVFKNYTVRLFGTEAIAYNYFRALIWIKKPPKINSGVVFKFSITEGIVLITWIILEL
jgi:hypothetical protein